MTALLLVAATLAADPLPPGAVARVGSTRFRSTVGAGWPILSTDGTRLALVGANGVTVFDAATGYRHCHIRGPLSIADARFTTDGTLLIIGADGESGTTITRHDPLTGRLIGVHPVSTDRIGTFAISPDGALVAIAAENGLRIMDIATGRPTAGIEFISQGVGPIRSCEFSADGSRLMIVPEIGGLLLYDRRTAARVTTLPGREPFDLLASSRDGSRLAVASTFHTTIRVLNARDGSVVCQPKLPRGVFERVAFAAAGLLVYGQGTVSIYDPVTGKRLREFIASRYDIGMVVSPDGRTLYAGTITGGVAVWDIETGELLPRSADPPEPVKSLRFVRPDRLVAYTDCFGWFGYDRGGSGERLGRPQDNRSFTDISLDEKLMVRVDRVALTVTEVRGGKTLLTVPVDKLGEIGYIEFAPDNRTVYAATERGPRAWDLPAGTPRPFDVGPGGPVQMILASPDNTQLAVIRAAPDGVEGAQSILRLTDRSTGAARVIVPLGGAYVPREMQFSRDSRRLMMVLDPPRNDGNAPSHLYVFDAATGRRLHDIGDPKFQLYPLAISPDGRCVATSTDDGRTAIIELCTGGIRWSNNYAADGSPDALVFSADNRTLAIAGWNDPILIWDIRGRTGPTPKLNVDAAWRALASADAGEAYRAMITLERHPTAARELFRRRLKPPPAVDPVAVAAWLKQLDAPAYRDREAAMAGLTAIAGRIRPELLAARAKSRSPETRERIEELLTVSDTATPEARRAERAAEVQAQIIDGVTR